MTKNTKIITLVTGFTGLATLTLMSGPVVTVQVPAPVVTVQVPAPVITVVVPDTYVWDGFEFVGVVGTQCFYLGAGDYWLPCDSVRLARFHDWGRAHPDWRAHVVVNERYRLDAHGHVHPWQGDSIPTGMTTVTPAIIERGHSQHRLCVTQWSPQGRHGAEEPGSMNRIQD